MNVWLLVAAYFILAPEGGVIQIDHFPQPIQSKAECEKIRDQQIANITAQELRDGAILVGHAFACVEAPVVEFKAPEPKKSGAKAIPPAPKGPLGNKLEYTT